MSPIKGRYYRTNRDETYEMRNIDDFESGKHALLDVLKDIETEELRATVAMEEESGHYRINIEWVKE
jgi:hypothetical protein